VSWYLAGIWSGALEAQDASGSAVFCLPSGGAFGQLVLIFMDWAKHNPARLNEDAAKDALASFVVAYPCGHKD
jgi:Ssp1 endopeptidase immunity protein Rap1a